MEFQGDLCFCLVSDSILGYSILIPILSCLFNFLDMKAVKNTGREDRRPRYLFYFAFISGFNNHSVGEEILPEYK